MNHFLAQAVIKAIPNSTDSINDTMGKTMNSIVENFDKAQSAAADILISLIVIEVLVFLIYAMAGQRGDDFIKGLVQKLFLILTITFLTLNWGAFAGAIRGYVAGAGGAAGGSGSSISAGVNPAGIADSGIKKISIIFDAHGRERVVNSFLGAKKETKVTPPDNATSTLTEAQSQQKVHSKKVIKHVETTTLTDEIKKRVVSVAKDAHGGLSNAKYMVSSNAIIDKFGDAVEAQALRMAALFTFIVLALMIVFVHFYVALQVFIISVEFYIITSITVCFIPFGMNKHTSYLATGAINSVIASSVKLGVLVMILSLLGDPINQMTLSNTPDLRELLSLLFNTATIAFLVSRAPSIAAATFTGGGAGIDISSAVSSAVSSVSAPAKAGAVAGTKALGRAQVNQFKNLKGSSASKRAKQAASKARGFTPRAGARNVSTTNTKTSQSKTAVKKTPSAYGQKLAGSKKANAASRFKRGQQRSAARHQRRFQSGLRARARAAERSVRNNPRHRPPAHKMVKGLNVPASLRSKKMPGVMNRPYTQPPKADAPKVDGVNVPTSMRTPKLPGVVQGKYAGGGFVKGVEVPHFGPTQKMMGIRAQTQKNPAVKKADEQ